MTGELELTFAYEDGRHLDNLPVVIDIADSTLEQAVQIEAVQASAGWKKELRPGTYLARIRFPSGLVERRTCNVRDGEKTRIPIVIESSAGVHTMSSRSSSIPHSGGAGESASTSGNSFAEHWVLCWSRMPGHSWTTVDFDGHAVLRDNQRMLLQLRTAEGSHFLQTGGPRSEWRFTALPPGPQVQVSASLRGPLDLSIEVTVQNVEAQALYSYMRLGNMDSAAAVAERMLSCSPRDAVSAALGGYYLLRCGRLDELTQWIPDLASRFPQLPDCAVISAWRHIRAGRKGVRDAASHFSAARDQLVLAARVGVPVYTEGLRMLVSGLKLVYADSNGVDTEVRAALQFVEPYASAADDGSVLVTYRGIHPNSPTTSVYTGEPSGKLPVVLLSQMSVPDLSRIQPQANRKHVIEKPTVTPFGSVLWHDQFGQPSTIGLIKIAAELYPDEEVPSLGAESNSFADLKARVDAKVSASETQPNELLLQTILSTPTSGGKSPESILSAMRTINSIRASALRMLGFDRFNSLVHVFKYTALAFPDRTALTDSEGRALTYRELDRLSNFVSGSLRRSGIGEGQVVALAMPRSIDMIVALLGVLKSGAAYVPMDLRHPLDRLAYIASDASPSLIITDEKGAKDLVALSVPIALLQDLATVGAEPAATYMPHHANRAYVMYTSGSTGRPKGVIVTHDAVLSLLRGVMKHHRPYEQDVVAMSHSYAFDVSVFEVWSALAFGGRLVIIDYLTSRAPDKLASLVERESITILAQTPSSFYQLAASLRSSNSNISESVRVINLAGEAVGIEQVRRWYREHDEKSERGLLIVNMYGPTEATVYATVQELSRSFVERHRTADIGVGLPGVSTHLLDLRLHPVPDGVPGELYLAGQQLAEGYLNRSDMTASSFVANPFESSGSRMYRTGDICIRRNGLIEYVGRTDFQVKLRGFRVELGEVESIISNLTGVDAAVALVKTMGSQEQVLVGYVVLAEGVTMDTTWIRAAVAEKVPDYMVPSIIMVLDSLPLTVNGKLDRKALPEPHVEIDEGVRPANSDEQRVAEIFGVALGIDSPGVTTPIFDLGGTSLTAARLSALCVEELGMDVTVRDIFEEPTVRGLMKRVAERPLVPGGPGRAVQTPALEQCRAARWRARLTPSNTAGVRRRVRTRSGSPGPAPNRPGR